MIKLIVSGGGGGTFRVQNEKRPDLELSSNLTPYEAVHAVAEWLADPARADEPAVIDAIEPRPSARPKVGS